MPPFSHGIRRLCLNYAACLRRWDLDFVDDAFTRDFIARHMSVDGLQNHYVFGSLTVDEFEQCVDVVLRGRPVESTT